MITLIAAPANNERGPRYMEKALASIHQSALHRTSLTFSYGAVGDHIGLVIQYPKKLQETVMGPIIANYPQCSFSHVEFAKKRDGTKTWTLDLWLVPELLPILRHAQFEDQLNHNFADPMSALLRSIKPDGVFECRVDIRCRPASHSRCHSAWKAVKRLDREFFRRHHLLARYYATNSLRGRQWPAAWILGLFAAGTPEPSHSLLETSTSRLHEREEDLQAASDKIGGHLFETRIRLMVRGPVGEKSEALARLRTMAGAFGAFTRPRLATFRSGSINHKRHGTFLLSHEELATLWHPPTASTAAERMKSSDFIEFEGPANFQSVKETSVELGSVAFRGDDRPVSLSLDDRRRHLYVVGRTGMGKSTLLLNMLAADLVANRGVCLVDPHGDLADALVGLIPKNRTNDVILFDAASHEHIINFNPLACRDLCRIDQVTSGVVSAFKKINSSWGPRLEDLLRNAVFATVERQGNLHSVMRLLSEKQYREQTVPLIRDEVVRAFFEFEFSSWSDNYRIESVASILNKLRPFIVNTNIRAIVTQSGPSLDFRDVMDDGKILIVNLSKGRLGEDNSTLLGALIVTSIQQAALTRSDVPEEQRRDFFLYVDEFQNFTTDSFATVLSEARKFRLSLTVAHQYLSQLPEATADAVWGNVGSVVSFQVGSDDAEMIARQLGKYAGQIAPESLTSLPKYMAYVRLLIKGMPSSPFSMRTLPPPQPSNERAEIVRRVAKRRFSHSAMGSLLFIASMTVAPGSPLGGIMHITADDDCAYERKSIR